MKVHSLKLLNGLKVVELASVLAGPSVGTFLAEQGARVIKIENPHTGGDPTRQWKTGLEDSKSSISAYYASANWGKEILFRDLKNPDHRAELQSELADTDILIHNFKPGDEAKFDLDYAALKSAFPKLIVAHVSGYEMDDSRPAFDIVLQAESGFMSINGTTESGPVKLPLPLVDILAAHHMKEALLLGLIRRTSTGTGCFVHVSLFDAAIASLTNVANNVLMGQMDPGPMGSLHPNIAPYGEMLVTSDGHSIVLAVGTDHQFESLCAALGSDPGFVKEFSTNKQRLKDRLRLGQELNRMAGQFSLDGLEKSLVQKKVPFGRIRSVKSVLKNLPEHYFLNEVMEGNETIRLRSSIFSIHT